MMFHIRYIGRKEVKRKYVSDKRSSTYGRVNDNIDDLPKDIHPNNLSYKENEEWLVFGGMHSIFN